MKFSSIIYIALIILALLSSDISARRIRRHRRTTALTDYLRAFAQGFISGFSGEKGESINECLPEGAKGDYLAKDITEKKDDKGNKEGDGKESDDDKKKDVSLFETIWQKIKWCLDLACKFKSTIMKFLGWDKLRRRYRRHRRFFARKKYRKGLFDWVSKAWEWIKKTAVSFGSWTKHQFENLVAWSKDKWDTLKDWGDKLWQEFQSKVIEEIQKVTGLKNKVVGWIINKALPVLSIVLKCTKIVLTIISKVFRVITVIAEIASGNALKVVSLVVNLICAYQTIIKVLSKF